MRINGFQWGPPKFQRDPLGPWTPHIYPTPGLKPFTFNSHCQSWLYSHNVHTTVHSKRHWRTMISVLHSSDIHLGFAVKRNITVVKTVEWTRLVIASSVIRPYQATDSISVQFQYNLYVDLLNLRVNLHSPVQIQYTYYLKKIFCSIFTFKKLPLPLP